MRALAVLLGLVLIGAGGLAGAFALRITPLAFQSHPFSGSGLLPIWGIGIVLGIGAILLGIRLMGRLDPSDFGLGPHDRDTPTEKKRPNRPF